MVKKNTSKDKKAAVKTRTRISETVTSGSSESETTVPFYEMKPFSKKQKKG